MVIDIINTKKKLNFASKQGIKNFFSDSQIYFHLQALIEG